MDILISVLSFVVALGLLIAIHEFGHFWVARKVGVKVITFSIGFGKPLWTKTFGEDKTQFSISAIPLGGYVKMLDEREGEVEAHELHRAFTQKTLGQRFAVVVAGPVANFVFAIFAYWALFIIGVPGVKPIVDAVEVNSPFAQAGLQQGDQIISIDGKDTPTLESARMALIESIMDQAEVDVIVSQFATSQRTLSLDLTQTPVDAISGNLLQYLGFTQYRPKLPPIIGRVVEGGAGQAAGMLEGDEIILVDGRPMDDWMKWAEYVRTKANKAVDIVIFRDQSEMSLVITPALIETQNGNIGRVGLGPYVPENFYDELRATQRYSLIPGMFASLQKTWDMSILTLQMFWKMLSGQASLENISGPISIAQYAGMSAQIGYISFISFMAIISVSLGVLNLLPVPLLDGGHLMYYTIEFIKGSPVSEAAQIIGQKIGILLLGSLMFLAVMNDITRVIS
ncbi:MAG: RIP metalloprotease RseP [Gammaproteobacteria bacterium]|nr:RIP metalloprotease RseP [Gammaproteobacteria bacterium]